MFDTTQLSRTVLLIALIVPLAACGNSPQQPSDEVDDRAADSPYLGGAEEEEPATGSPDFAEFAENDGGNGGESVDETAGSETLPELDPVVTGNTLEATSISEIAGSWASDPNDCGAGGGTVVTITEERFERTGQQCDIASTIDSGQGSIAATLTCPSVAGATPDSEIVKLAPQEDGTLQMNIVGSEDPPRSFERCP